MQININGAEDCVRSLDIELGKITGKAVTAMKRAGVLVKGAAQELCPSGGYSGGGSLRESIRTKTENGSGRITTTVYTNEKYAAYVEFGTGPLGDPRVAHTSKTEWVCRIPAFAGHYGPDDEGWRTMKGQRPRPFMYPALERNKTNVKKLIKEALR